MGSSRRQQPAAARKPDGRQTTLPDLGNTWYKLTTSSTPPPFKSPTPPSARWFPGRAGGDGRQVTVFQKGGGGGCKGISRQNVVSSNDASKQNTGGRASSARVGDRGRSGGLMLLYILSKGLVDLDLVTPLAGWGSVQAVCAIGVLKAC